MASQIALGMDYLGRRNEAWKQTYPPLIEVSTLDAPASRISICEMASWLAKAEGEKEIALYFQEEAVRSAIADGTAVKVALALRGRAERLVALGEKESAKRDLRLAEQRLGDIPDLTTRQSVKSDLDRTAAELASSPQEAISKLNGAIQAYRSPCGPTPWRRSAEARRRSEIWRRPSWNSSSSGRRFRNPRNGSRTTIGREKPSNP
jgi:hypothetical protein